MILKKYPNFTEETRDAIYNDLRAKGGEKSAALAGGISVTTLKKWILQGEYIETQFEEGLWKIGTEPDLDAYYKFVVDARLAEHEGIEALREPVEALLSVKENVRPDIGLLREMLGRVSAYPDAIQLKNDLDGLGNRRLMGVLITEPNRIPPPSPSREEYIDVAVRRVEEETD
jgi:hypothetical protein